MFYLTLLALLYWPVSFIWMQTGVSEMYYAWQSQACVTAEQDQALQTNKTFHTGGRFTEP